MPNKEIQIFQIPPYSQIPYVSASYLTQTPAGLEIDQDIIINKSISTEIRIVRKIRTYRLAWSLILSVSYEDDLVFVDSEVPNIWGEGDTLEEAIKSYEDYFFYEFDSYKDTPSEEMDFFARQELKLYKALLNIS